MAAYATSAQLATYLGVEEAALPADVARLLNRASEDIDAAALPNVIDITVTAQATAAQNATCAQVEYWITAGESVSLFEGIRSFSLGKFSMDFAGRDGQGAMTRLGPRARQFLLRAGLLYAGVDLA